MNEFSPARLAVATELPRGSGWAYEPKFDGYRCLLGRDAHGRPFALSRNRKDLARYLPELLRLAEGLPVGTMVDGEAVKPTPEGVSFTHLQRRLMLPIGDRDAESTRAPAALVAFDLLSDRHEDVRSLRLSERRRRLERVVKTAATRLMQLVIQVEDPRAARVWLEDPPLTGIEGVVAKRDEAYPAPTARRWRKIRRLITMDFPVLGFVGDLRTGARLVLGVQTEHGMKVAGTSQQVGARDMAPLEPLLPLAEPGDRRIWAPFDGDGHDTWVRLPAHLTAEVVVGHLDGLLLRQPAASSDGDSSSQLQFGPRGDRGSDKDGANERPAPCLGGIWSAR
jgi:ATP-dependent DNA ligase